MTIQKNKYGITESGKAVDSYTLINSNGIEVSIITYGGIITSIKTPDKKGNLENIVLGYDALQPYLKDDYFLGAIIGRCANRIANGRFTLDGNIYTLEKNDDPNNLHGGSKGLDKVLWKASTQKSNKHVSLVLNYLCKDMEGGFPGNLNITVRYTLTSNNVLDILDHSLQIQANEMLPVNEFLIPKGTFEKVANTPFDFRTFKAIGKAIESDNEQLKLGTGYDHCWVLNNQNNGVRSIASAHHKERGRFLEVFSDEPGVQLYTGNHLDGVFGKRTGFCLETQHFPDAPNQNDFPSVELKPDEEYTSRTSFKFRLL